MHEELIAIFGELLQTCFRDRETGRFLPAVRHDHVAISRALAAQIDDQFIFAHRVRERLQSVPVQLAIGK